MAHPQNSELTISEDGLDFIKSKESWKPRTYRDPVGVLTIGWGTTGPEARPGRTITKEVGERLLREAEGGIDESEGYVRNLVKVPLTQGQFDALVSLVFNMGVGNFQKSPVLRLLNQGNYRGAAAQFPLHNTARDRDTGKVKVLPGLTKRRNEEMLMFLAATDVVEMNDEVDAEEGVEADGPPSSAVERPGMSMMFNSRTFQAIATAFGSVAATVLALLKPLAANPWALATVLIALIALGAAIFFKLQDTKQGR